MLLAYLTALPYNVTHTVTLRGQSKNETSFPSDLRHGLSAQVYLCSTIATELIT